MDKELRKNLFIIGNGFDIAHGIPSKYTDFQKFIRSLYMTKELIDKSYDSFLFGGIQYQGQTVRSVIITRIRITL